MKTFRLYWFFTLLLLLTGCNQKDDVNEIFSSGQTWHWSNSYSTSDWKDDNNFNSTLTRDEAAKINDSQDSYNIIFKEDGTVEGNGSNFSFTGTWSANGEDQSFSIQLKPSGNRSGLDKTFYDEISNAKFYRGSSRTIKLFNLDKNHYIQFYPKGFND